MELASNYLERWNKFQSEFSNIIQTYLPIHDASLRLMDGDLACIQNILFHSVYGFPLDLLWKEALIRRFQIDASCIVSKECIWGKDIPYYETPYYFHIDISNPAISNDLDILQEFLKSIISTRCILHERHIVILENIDTIVYKQVNKNSFRVLLERFSKNVWFICTTYHIEKLEAPLRSRFQSIRIPMPTEQEVNDIMKFLDEDEDGVGEVIYHTRNIIRALVTPANQSESIMWISSLTFPPLNDFIINTKIVTIENVRAIVYKAFQCGIRVSEFAKDILQICIRRRDPDEILSQLLKEFTKYEHSAAQSKGTRTLLYMEYMLYYVMTMDIPKQKGRTKTKTKTSLLNK